ncbi:molybdopterin-dependent oxidoreductase [Congregibacter sp.]|uniref:molybdopterin-containing oxidoreductase family protein n=1 Tax=Congregibacter sp. TaxID=2744308 RepID=UPI00385D34CA
MNKVKNTFCRICEPACPLKAHFDDSGDIIQLSPDPDHPSDGIPCHKGLSYLDIHHSPDRLNWPLKRTNPRVEPTGKFQRLGWDDALGEIGKKLRDLRDQHGANAIAFFSGNPGVFDSRQFINQVGLIMGSGSKMVFHSGTQDMTNKTRGCYDLYGTSSLPIPDLTHTSYLLCIGANPKVSHWALMSQPNDALGILKKIRARGGKTVFVNPRKTESSISETGETLQIKPGTDVYFLAALLNEIAENNDIATEHVTKHGKNLEELLNFVRLYPAARVSKLTGIDEAVIKQVAREFAAADGAAAYVSLGVNQGGQGLLGYWLAEMLNFVTGNLGRKGGTFTPNSVLKHKMAIDVTQLPTFASSIGELQVQPPGIPLPSVILPDLIETGEIKALIVFGGNPILSVGGEVRLRKAFEKLELLVATDIMLNATGELADYVLPATGWLERADINFIADGMQGGVPYVQYTDAMVPPEHERKEDWWINDRLAQELGVPCMLDRADTEGFDTINNMLSAADLSVAKLRDMPHQTATRPPEPYYDFYTTGVLHADGKVECYPPAFVKAGLIERCENIFKELEDEPEGLLKLGSFRTNHMHNSWMTNLERMRQGALERNPIHMNPEDARARHLFDGDEVRVFNRHGSISTVLHVTEDMRQGAVAMTHGYTDGGNPNLTIASAARGSNPNQLMPSAADSYEPLSNMSRLGAVSVEVCKL